MNLELHQHIQDVINNQLSANLKFNWQPIGGGSINNTYKITANNYTYFVKTNTVQVFENGFKEEVLGLQFLKSHHTLTPKIISEGVCQESIYLVLEWVETGVQTSNFWKNFAHQLANLHQHKSAQFGLEYTNYMGQLSQNNTFSNSFTDFFIENRLKPQVELAFNSNLLQTKHRYQFEKLYKQLPAIFPSEKPSAVHGDLWSGNFICNSQEKAVFIDPAVYYGHREVDVAMSMLFGGFSQDFYATYQEIYPLEKGFHYRKDYYNLYPLLIHLNLFGSSYLRSIEKILSQF